MNLIELLSLLIVVIGGISIISFMNRSMKLSAQRRSFVGYDGAKLWLSDKSRVLAHPSKQEKTSLWRMQQNEAGRQGQQQQGQGSGQQPSQPIPQPQPQAQPTKQFQPQPQVQPQFQAQLAPQPQYFNQAQPMQQPVAQPAAQPQPQVTQYYQTQQAQFAPAGQQPPFVPPGYQQAPPVPQSFQQAPASQQQAPAFRQQAAAQPGFQQPGFQQPSCQQAPPNQAGFQQAPPNQVSYQQAPVAQHPHQQPTYAPRPPAFQPPYPQGYGNMMQPPERPRKDSSVEQWIGRNLIGVIAAIMVFIGILFLGFLIVPTLSDVMKMLLMFVLSLVLTAAGFGLTRYKKNPFSVTLLGCGSGSLFISIMVAHAYFQVIPDVAAFALLLVWMAGSLVLVKVSDSLLMSIIVHVGMIFSLCFAYTIGMSGDKVLLLLIYQALSVGIITAGNLICYKKTYRFGLFASFALSLIASISILNYYAEAVAQGNTGSLPVAIAAMIIQGIGAVLLSYFLYTSILAVKNKTTRTFLQCLNKLLIVALFFVVGYLFPLDILNLLFPSGEPWLYTASYVALMVAAVCALVFVLAHGAVSLFLRKKHQTDPSFEMISLIILGIYAVLVLLYTFYSCQIYYPDSFRIPAIVFIALGFFFVAHQTKDKSYTYLAFGVLALDFVIMIEEGYAVLVNFNMLIVALVYLCFYIAILVYEWSCLDKDKQQKMLITLKTTILVVYELSILAIVGSADIRGVFTLLAFSAAFVIIFAAKLDTRQDKSRTFSTVIQVHALVLVFLDALYIASGIEESIDIILYLVLALLGIALLGFVLYRIIQANSKRYNWIAAVVGVGFSTMIISVISGLSNWLDVPYVFSLTLMATALLCIAGGFFSRLKPLRLYGLILILICVLKLVTLDIGNAETIMRVVTFIAGGLMCFGISAFYSYTAKWFDSKEGELDGFTN